jgi:hypothetical protein
MLILLAARHFCCNGWTSTFGMSLLLAGNGGTAREGCAALWTHQE